MKNKSKTSSSVKAGGYRFLAIVFFLLAVGGLFLGLLSNVKLPGNLGYLFSHGWLFEPDVIANSGSFLKGSLIGTVGGIVMTLLNWLKAPNLNNFGLFGDGVVQGSRSWFELIASVALVVFVFLLALTVILSTVFMIASLVSGKSAKKCATGSGILILLSYGGLFLLNFVASCSLAGTPTDPMFDFATAAVAGLTFLFMLFAALIRNKGTGFMNVLNVLLTLATLVALVYPGTQTAALIGAAPEGLGIYDRAAGITFLVIAVSALLGLIGFNLLCGVSRLNGKRGFLFDIVRYALMLIAAILVIVALLVTPAYKGGVFAKDIIFTIVMLAAPLLAALFSVFLLIGENKRKKAAKKAAAETAAFESDAFEYSDEDVVDEIVDDEIHRYIKEHRPAPAPASAPAPAPQPKEEPKSEPAPAPIYQPNIIVQAPPQPEQKPREKTEFERRMEAIAREEASNPPSPYEQRTRDTSNAQAFPPIFTRYKKNNMQQMQIEDDHVSPYMAGHYDPFLSKLTSQEVSEFGDLFISNKYGMQNYLPVYVIGGDNDEFFNKVFIYLGRFRNYISAELLEKLNQYVSAVRSQK